MRRPGEFTRFLAFYGAVFAAFGVASPFLPALLLQNGLSSTELGVALAAGTAVRLVTGPAGGRWADRVRRVPVLLAGFTAASALVALGYGPVRGLLLLAAVGVAHAAVLAPIVPIADALATRASADSGRFRYGWVRGAGSAAFVAATLVSGQLVERWELGAIIPLNAGLLAVAAAFALALPGQPAREPGRGQARLPASALLRVPGFTLLMTVAALIGGSHAMHDGFEVIRWQEAGMTPGAASVLWSLSVLSEVVVFVVVGPALLARLGLGGALALSAAAGVVRWGAVALTASFPVMAVVEPLHGLTFALVHLACVTGIGRMVPESLSATAQAFYSTFALGTTGAAVTLGSGPLYGRFGAPAFWAMALLCAMAVPLALALRVIAPSAPSRRSATLPREPGSN